MVQSLHEISTKALMQRIADELEGLIVADAEGRYAYVNQRWSSLTGYTFEQVKGRYVRDVVRLSRVDEVLKTQKFVSGDAILLNSQTGEEVPVYCSYTPLFHENKLEGCLVYMIRKNEDVSMAVPSHVVSLLEELNRQMQLLQSFQQNTVDPLDRIVGNSPEILKMKHEIVCAARSSSTVLIDGETGSGKELVAHAIHELSPRCKNRLIKVNCAAIPAELLESEFFGYVEGAFTGASRGGRIGKFEMANGGSLFLDEINQMPLALQPKLLRVLQEREIERLGGSRTIPVNVRVIAATNRDLWQMVEDRQFRSDLFYRLNVFPLELPPLRDRPEDIPLLAKHFTQKMARHMNRSIDAIPTEALRQLMSWDWPGNVRELENVIERAVLLTRGNSLNLHLNVRQSRLLPTLNEDSALRSSMAQLLHPTTPENDEEERQRIVQVLRETNGIVAGPRGAATRLGMKRTTLLSRMQRLGISVREVL
mgnify:CR=1 FL=1